MAVYNHKTKQKKNIHPVNRLLWINESFWKCCRSLVRAYLDQTQWHMYLLHLLQCCRKRHQPFLCLRKHAVLKSFNLAVHLQGIHVSYQKYTEYLLEVDFSIFIHSPTSQDCSTTIQWILIFHSLFYTDKLLCQAHFFLISSFFFLHLIFLAVLHTNFSRHFTHTTESLAAFCLWIHRHECMLMPRKLFLWML